MSSIVVTGKYKVATGETLSFTDETAFILGQDGQPRPSLVNDGAVHVVNDQFNEALVAVVQHVKSSVPVTNAQDGTFEIEGTAKRADVLGFQLLGGQFINAGEIDVSSLRRATGIEATRALDFHNTGSFHVEGLREADGVSTGAAGSFNNEGDFTVTSSKGSAFGIAVDGGTGENSGDISVTGASNTAYITAIGVRLTGDSVFDNTGHVTVGGAISSYGVQAALQGGETLAISNDGSIDAYYAVTADGGRTVTLDNSGEMTGSVNLNSGHVELVNSGQIHGAVSFGAGDDLYQSTAGGVVGLVYAGLGNDQLFGGDSGDELYGDYYSSTEKRGGADLLVGGGGDDRLAGGGGADTLIGGAGSDDLFGGKGADLFVYQALSDSTNDAADFLSYFTPSTDTIDVSAIDADTTKDGDQAFTKVAALDGHAGELALVWQPSQYHTDLLLDVDGDGQADFTAHIYGNQTDFSGLVL